MKKNILFNKHFRMERFSMMFVTLSSLMLVVLISALFLANKQAAYDISEKSLYTSEFTMSKTGVGGKVEGVYTNKERTKAFIVLKFNDASQVSTNANNYQAFLTGADVQRNKVELKGAPSGSIYTFGSTGYIGVYLVNKSKFEQQILDLTIRSNAEIVPTLEKIDTDEELGDASFDKYDQFRINFNPSGNDAKVLKLLDSKEAPSAVDLYNDTVVETNEAEIRTNLDKELKDMKTQLAAMDEYKHRVEQYGVVVPNLNNYIKGDKITGKDDALYLNAGQIVPGGFNFDWRSKTVRDGYLKDLLVDGITSERLIIDSNNKKSENPINLDVDKIVWRLKDGSLLESLDTGSSQSKYTTIKKDIDLLTQTWEKYLTSKKQYQTTDLIGLLELEDSINLVTNTSIINTNDKALLVY